MKLTIKEVEYIAGLARLKLSDKEKEKLAHELSSILDYVEALKKVATDKVEAGQAGTIGLESVSRDDEVEIFDDQKSLLEQAPAKENNYFKIRSVFDK